MTTIGLIVEGHGEVSAAPVLIRRIAAALGADVECPRPWRVPRGKLVQREEVERAVELVSRRVGGDGAILVLLDADDDCPAELGPKLRGWVRRGDRRVTVAVAHKEYEAWFLAGASTLAGKRTLPDDLADHPDPEGLRHPKSWLNTRMTRGYSETVDQAALTAALGIESACRSASFCKLVRAVAELLGVDPLPVAARPAEKSGGRAGAP